MIRWAPSCKKEVFTDHRISKHLLIPKRGSKHQTNPRSARRVPGSPDNPPESGKCLLGLHPRALDEKKTDFYFRPRCMAPPTAPTRTPAMVTAPATAPTATRRRLRTTTEAATRARTATGTERLGGPLFLVSARPRCLERRTVDGFPETIIRHHMHDSQTTCFSKDLHVAHWGSSE